MAEARHSVDRFTPPMPGCQFCDRGPGLAILPVRYAVVGPEQKAGVPPLSASFRIDGAPAQLGGGAQYTLRTMRSGLLYVFHEAPQRWDCYLVIQGGHLWKIAPDRPAPPRTPDAFHCSVGIGHGYLSMSLTIPDPKQATVIWYAYSHVQWTDAQLDAQAKDVSLRRKHMQCFEVSAWLGSHQQPHAAPIAELCQRVATFATTPDQQDAAFQYLSDPPRVRSGARPDLIGQRAGAILAESMARRSPGDALMLAFNDPLGMTEDLGLLTRERLHPNANNGVIWDQTTDFLLDQLEAHVRRGAIRDYEDALARERAGLSMHSEGMNAFELFSAILSPDETAARWKREEAERNARREAHRKTVGDEAWQPYADALDNTMRHRNLAPRLKALNEDVLAPIAASQAAWMESPQLRDYMRYRHDPRHLAHGYHFNEALSRCLEHSLDTVECRRLIRRWHDDANPGRHDNLLARALYLNFDPVIETAAEYKEQAMGAMLAVLGGAFQQIDVLIDKNVTPAGAIAQLGLVPRLAWLLSSEIVTALATKLGTGTARMYVHGLSLFSGIQLVAANRSVMDIRAQVLDDLKDTNPDLYKQLGRTQHREDAVAAARRINRLRDTARLIWYDPADLASNKGLAALQLRSERDVPGAKQVKSLLGSRYVNLGALSVILQAVVVQHAAQAYRASGDFDEKEKGTKLAAGLVSMVGTAAEKMGEAIEKAPAHPLVARWMRAVPREEWVARGASYVRIGQWLGFAGASVGAGWDAYHAIDERTKDNYLMATLYGTASLSGAAAAGLPIAARQLTSLSGVPAWPFLVALTAANIGIAILDDPAALKWTAQCRFSKQRHGPYSSMYAEWHGFVQLNIKYEEKPKS